MNVTHKPLARAILVLAAVLALLLASGLGQVSADDITPVPDGVTPEPTAVVTVPTVGAVTDPTQLPTITQERVTPIPTDVVVPTSPPTTLPTAVRSRKPTVSTPMPASTSPASPVLPEPAATPANSDPWPSPDDLRQNARIRWGGKVPASVRRWAFLIVPAARTYHLDPNLIAAVMTMESNGDPLALSPADARGLMQILHGPWDPQENVNEGAKMLATLHDQFNDWTLTFAAYNAGPGAVESYGGVPPFRETRDYVIIVQYLWDLYGHHKLTVKRKAQYRSTLKDLQHVASQRKKVRRLARVGGVPSDIPNICAANACLAAPSPQQYNSLDPFWPVAGVPDPLQKVTPFPTSP